MSTTTIKDLIEDAGGRVEVCYDLRISTQAVSNWSETGIPLKHWPYFMDKARATLKELWAIEESIKGWTRQYEDR